MGTASSCSSFHYELNITAIAPRPGLRHRLRPCCSPPGTRKPGVAIRQACGKIRHVTFPRSKFAFLTLPRYSMIALSNAVEPLRMANSITGQSVYEWSIVSLDGQPTPASNGLQLSPTHALEAVGAVDILFVCGGVDVQAAVSPKIL